MDIKKIMKKINEFTHQNLGQDARIVGIQATEAGWKGVVEVYEDNAFIKSLGLETNAKVKNVYQVELDEQLNVMAFGQTQGAS